MKPVAGWPVEAAAVRGAVATRVAEHATERLARQAPGVASDRLLFCAKETVYKAWFPVTRRWLGFEDARVQLLDRGFRATVGAPGVELAGRWARAGGVLVATLTLDDEQGRRLAAAAGSPSGPAGCPQVFPQAGDGITPV